MKIKCEYYRTNALRAQALWGTQGSCGEPALNPIPLEEWQSPLLSKILSEVRTVLRSVCVPQTQKLTTLGPLQADVGGDGTCCGPCYVYCR